MPGRIHSARGGVISDTLMTCAGHLPVAECFTNNLCHLTECADCAELSYELALPHRILSSVKYCLYRSLNAIRERHAEKLLLLLPPPLPPSTASVTGLDYCQLNSRRHAVHDHWNVHQGLQTNRGILVC